MKKRIILKRLARRNRTREQVEKVHANEVEKRFKQYSKAVRLFSNRSKQINA